MTLGKFHAIDVPVWGEIACDLRNLFATGSPGSLRQTTNAGTSSSAGRSGAPRKKAAPTIAVHGMNSAAIFAALTRQVADDAIIAVDVGNNTYSLRSLLRVQRQAVLMSGYLGSIGFSFPAAMGAWAATQDDDPRFAGDRSCPCRATVVSASTSANSRPPSNTT